MGLAELTPIPLVKGCLKIGDQGNKTDTTYTSNDTIPVLDPLPASLPGIRLTDGQVYLSAGADGNIYVQTSPTGATLFQNLTTLSSKWRDPQIPRGLTKSYTPRWPLLVDDRQRALFFFPDTMAAFGVSRLRLLDFDEVPGNARQTVFAPGNLDGKSETQDTHYLPDIGSPEGDQGGAYFPVVCEVTDAVGREGARVFAVKDVEEGVERLMGNEVGMRGTVTGGTVGKCSVLLLRRLCGEVDGCDCVNITVDILKPRG
ncbi:hypothetical protein KVT40_008892 [Elsinoe batatas]|uniref:Uncharacterized protein n=1 Tax=Elsinoe batatas TaxID=2601811 RepID=A0A8K0KXS1_9PEZI|nr:hypothetical protein KVT40_008892 [Elsinoe batatas]